MAGEKLKILLVQDRTGPLAALLADRQDCEIVSVSADDVAAQVLRDDSAAVLVPAATLAGQVREIARLREEEARLREALEVSEARFGRLRESGLIGICFWREDGAITDANEAFLRLIGSDAAQLAAGEINWRELTPPEWDAADARALEEIREQGVTAVYEKEFVRSDNTRVSVLIGGVRVGTGDDIAFTVDMTGRRKIEEERARLIRELRVAVRARDEFLAVAAHELKTPLTPLRVQTEGLLRALQRPEGLTAEKLLDRLARIDRSARRVARLVENLLDFSRVASGRLQLRQEEIDLARLAGEVVERLRETAERAGSTLRFHSSGPASGRWDALRLEQVIENLLGNAIKYGSGQPIEVEVRGEGESALIQVTDHGMGIPKEAQGRIFQRFERVAPLHHFGGFGLGLWIVRQIVEAHGGAIELESDSGCGACFTIHLPRHAAEHPSPM
jgi:PAS domain S-box-containing protein